MKQCRFCDAMIPFYGSDTCAKCKKVADESTPGPWSCGGISFPGTNKATMNVWSATPKGAQSGRIVAHDCKPADAQLICLMKNSRVQAQTLDRSEHKTSDPKAK